MVAKSVALFAAAALAEIGGAYLVWIAIRDGKGLLAGALGAASLALYGIVAAYQPDNEFGRVLAAYGGVFIIGSMIWGVVFDGFEPDRYDLAGGLVCLIGVGVIMYAQMSAVEHNRNLVQRLVDAVNASDYDAIDQIATGQIAQDARRWIGPFQKSFPDFRMDLVEAVAEPDRVAAYFKCSGTHKGDWLGHPPTGRRFEGIDEVYVFTVEEGKLSGALAVVEDNLTGSATRSSCGLNHLQCAALGSGRRADDVR